MLFDFVFYPFIKLKQQTNKITFVSGVCDERKGSEVIEYCRPRISMWTYDKKSNQCLPFFGCKGDGNRFESKEECDRKCAWMFIDFALKPSRQ